MLPSHCKASFRATARKKEHRLNSTGSHTQVCICVMPFGFGNDNHKANLGRHDMHCCHVALNLATSLGDSPEIMKLTKFACFTVLQLRVRVMQGQTTAASLFKRSAATLLCFLGRQLLAVLPVLLVFLVLLAGRRANWFTRLRLFLLCHRWRGCCLHSCCGGHWSCWR